MPKTDVYKMDGSKVGTMDLSEAVFGQEVNKTVLHSVVVNYLANQRQGTQSAKTRSEVSGGGAKPFRQKGTGRARQGSTRAAQWIKGGIIFAPKPREYRFSINKKVKDVAMRSALSSKVLENEIMVMESLELEDIKTKQVTKMMQNLGVEGKALLVTCDKNDNLYLSARNIYGVDVSYVGMLNVYDILNHGKLIIAKNAVEKLEEVYA
ncbi:MAG: 50S ribosomal protein L4 [Ruminococcaceae bacterium]|nr:50S ribosomal protein L4 [Oscillospiraceae bacterium]